MFGRVVACGAAAVMMLPVLFVPAPSSAKGFAAGPAHHAGVFRAHVNRHGRHQHRRNPAGYASWPIGLGDYPPQETVVPVMYPIYVGPRCVHSVETVIVPAESGGTRRIRITRC